MDMELTFKCLFKKGMPKTFLLFRKNIIIIYIMAYEYTFTTSYEITYENIDDEFDFVDIYESDVELTTDEKIAISKKIVDINKEKVAKHFHGHGITYIRFSINVELKILDDPLQQKYFGGYIRKLDYDALMNSDINERDKQFTQSLPDVII